MRTASPLSLLAVGVAVLLALAPMAGATSRRDHGLTVVSPAAGATVPAGTAPTFVVRSKKRVAVHVRVCGSPARSGAGLICDDQTQGTASGSGRIHRWQPDLYTFSGYWLVTPGTYYWQPYRLDCSHLRGDCWQEGPVVPITVAAPTGA